MKVEISDVGSTRKEMIVVVPKQEVNDVTNEVYKDITQKVTIKGFRKGKAPRDIVKMFYADYIKGELSKKLVQDKFEQVARENDLFIVSMPEITNDPPQENEDFTFTARFDVKPVIAPRKYTGLELKKARVNVDEENIQDVLNRLRETYATVNDVEDKEYAARSGDYAIVDVVCEENPKLNRSRMTVEAGVRSALPGLDKAVEGMRIGDEKAVDVSFPEDHFIEDMRGQSVALKVKVEGIKNRQLPELDDEFAKTIRPEAEGMDDLKEAIRKDLLERLEAEGKSAVERQINDQLMKENPFDVPESMVRLQAAMMIQGMSRRLSSQGFKLEDLYPDPTALQAETMSSAENLVRTSLLVEAIAKEQGFEATDEELESELETLAQRYSMTMDLVKQGLEERGSLEEMRFGIVEKKVYNYIIDHSTVEEVDQVKENADDAGSDRS